MKPHHAAEGHYEKGILTIRKYDAEVKTRKNQKKLAAFRVKGIYGAVGERILFSVRNGNNADFNFVIRVRVEDNGIAYVECDPTIKIDMDYL